VYNITDIGEAHTQCIHNHCQTHTDSAGEYFKNRVFQIRILNT